ncbi:MAG: monovalent cation/H+ antiporter subunit D family protein [Nitrospirae bacterium]|jgi:multicomponent Na+:H+ antiporter subunit D|nr:monovalent cation/H+ antiporter subunit D family protein [Nitrospirota bacterium]
MEIIHSSRPALAILVSLIAAFLILITGERSRNLREFWTILASVVKFSVVLSMVPFILEGKVIEYTVLSISPGLSVQFRVDALGIIFGLTASFLWIITSFYSIGYVRSLKEHAQTRYFVCFAVALSATMGVAFSANMFTTFLFYEIITICTFPLVAHKETPEAIQGARKYLTYLLGTSIAFQLLAVFMTYHVAGTLDFRYEGLLNGARGNATDMLLIIIFILYMAGITKAAMMPLHGWLPAAMVAPTPVSALLHAVAVVKTGVFVVVKVVLHIFGINLLTQLGLGTALAYFACVTIVVASVIALTQDNLKRRLAYSTISQLSYVILGVALLTPSGITGSIMHITIHAFGKITLFFTAGAIYVATHKTNVSELDGIGRQMPFTMGAFTLGALSMIGVPPLGGFISKWYLALGAIEAEQLPVIIVLAASTLLNAGYFLPIVYAAFFKEPAPEHHHNPGQKSKIQEAPVLMVVPLVLTGIGAFVLFLAPTFFLDIARIALHAVVGGN